MCAQKDPTINVLGDSNAKPCLHNGDSSRGRTVDRRANQVGFAPFDQEARVQRREIGAPGGTQEQQALCEACAICSSRGGELACLSRQLGRKMPPGQHPENATEQEG